jgi:hypothetical protein
MRKSMNVKNRGYQNFLMELLLIQNIHPWRLHISYFIKKVFLPLKLMQFINLLLESINFTLFGMWTYHHSFMVPKSFILVGSQIYSCEVSNLVLMHCYSNGWFPIGCTIFGLVHSITSSNSFCSPLWKVIASSMSIFGCSSCSKLPTCPTLAISS